MPLAAEDEIDAFARHGLIEGYAVEPDEATEGNWHVFTFEDWFQIQIYSDVPCVLVEPVRN